MPRQIIPTGITSDVLDHPPVSAPVSKRKARKDGFNSKGRPIKRRALMACQICRERKVRCNVVEHGAPCSNCKSGAVQCTVPETKRKKKRSSSGSNLSRINGDHFHPRSHIHRSLSTSDISFGDINTIDNTSPNADNHSSRSSSIFSDEDKDGNLTLDMPHPLVSGQNRIGQAISFDDIVHSVGITGDLRASRIQSSSPQPLPFIQELETASKELSSGLLPAYIQPLPECMATDDVMHLWKKGATDIPETSFRNELLQSYIEFVHPYMPLLDLHDFLQVVDEGTGENGKVSLLLFQAVMFAGVAFVDRSYLTAAGYATRRSARKAFYLKTRALYDFDYESNGVTIVQALLLMSFWLETPDGQKDTWHWIGAAISSANAIGLHCNPTNSTTDVKTQKLWKRIWWSCLMRDRLAALGLRRIPRTKDDHDVPMLTLDDFEIRPLAAENTTISPKCKMIRDVAVQRDLALLCISQAKLSLCISHILSAQYSVLIRDQGTTMRQESNTRPSAILLPKVFDQPDEVNICDSELDNWVQSLPSSCLYRDPTLEEIEGGASTVIVQRTLLHMCYYATLAALHRPQLQRHGDLQEASRTKVHKASCEITRMSQSLHKLELTGYLYNAGLTVLLPAIIIHLLNIKSPCEATRYKALQRFCQCMQVLEKLRENYAIIDFETQFLDAAIQKAGIDIDMHLMATGVSNPADCRPKRIVQSASELVAAGRAARFTPPPDSGEDDLAVHGYSTIVDSIECEPVASFSAINTFLSAGSLSNSDAYTYGNDDGMIPTTNFSKVRAETLKQNNYEEGAEGLLCMSNVSEEVDNDGCEVAALDDSLGMTGELSDLVHYDGLAEDYSWAVASLQDPGQGNKGQSDDEGCAEATMELKEEDLAMSYLMEWCEGNID